VSLLQAAQVKAAVQIWPVGQLAAVRHWPGTHPFETQRWPAPYAAVQAASSEQGVHALETQIFPLLQSAAVWQSPSMQALLTQT